MDWTDLLKTEAEDTYRAAEGLVAMVGDDDLDWKPQTGTNWMTTGQLLFHIAGACGALCRGFVEGDWGMAGGAGDEMSPEEMLPPAESLPTAESVDAALQALAADKRLAFAMIEAAAGRFDEPVQAPWDPRPTALGRQLLGMIGHLNHHKGQLFFYLKLQGKPVNTMHLFGMA